VSQMRPFLLLANDLHHLKRMCLVQSTFSEVTRITRFTNENSAQMSHDGEYHSLKILPRQRDVQKMNRSLVLVIWTKENLSRTGADTLIILYFDDFIQRASHKLTECGPMLTVESFIGRNARVHHCHRIDKSWVKCFCQFGDTQLRGPTA
jgi:hypothetical protein